MVVQTRSKDGRFIGLYIGLDNVHRYFRPVCSSIELLLGHLHIDCELEPQFWLDQPEILDARLADWLESQCRGRLRGDCVSLTMTRITEGHFRVETIKAAIPNVPAAKLTRQQHATSSPGDD
ncbi:MAG: hypothetical protein P4L40_15715 [Terracidiphilus sp.]|nr:hypothetical protein [Terracidiphilus sp.]